jgi:hypothetical protein
MKDIFEGLKYVVVPDDCWEPVEDGWKGDWCYFQKGHIPWNKGKNGTCPPHQKEIQRMMAIERNKQYRGENNPRAKTWKITYKDGRELIVKALQRWAVDNGYSQSGIKNIAYGKWKTYRDLASVELMGP